MEPHPARGAVTQGVVIETLSNTPVVSVPFTWLVTAKPTWKLAGMAMVAVPITDQVVPLAEVEAVKLLPDRTSRNQVGMALLPVGLGRS
jgi:hypothetical protein